MKLNLSPGGLSISIASPIFLELLIDEENDIWERYEAFIQENGVTNLLFGKNIKFDHWGSLNFRRCDSSKVHHLKFSKSEGLL